MDNSSISMKKYPIGTRLLVLDKRSNLLEDIVVEEYSPSNYYVKLNYHWINITDFYNYYEIVRLC
jgi:hypothetical protein